jgi:hypothetical protein
MPTLSGYFETLEDLAHPTSVSSPSSEEKRNEGTDFSREPGHGALMPNGVSLADTPY